VIDPLVRPLRSSDIVEVRRLESDARSALVDRRGGPRWLETHPPHRGGPERCWVAVIDEVVVGYLAADVDGEVLVVRDVYVDPQAREVGFGDELLAAAMAHGREAGARLLEAEALPGDRDTKNLYERAGVTARLITVSTPL
jgi:ribosomal protein S18 acetylase RimI-like enzyme